MTRTIALKLTASFLVAVLAGMATTTAWRYGVLQALIERQAAEPAWFAALFGAVTGILCTLEFWVRPPCKYAAATMTAAAVVLLAGFTWATKTFGYWEATLSHVGDFGPTNAPWVVAGAGAAYMFYVALVILLFARSRR